MSYTDYQKAQKIGEKTYKTCVAKGKYPYLPVLEDMMSHENPCSQIRLGLVDIPIELIAGTYTASRTNAFSRGLTSAIPLQPTVNATLSSHLNI